LAPEHQPVHFLFSGSRHATTKADSGGIQVSSKKNDHTLLHLGIGSISIPTAQFATMALPSLTSLEDCADFSKAVEPFIPQLYDLPQKLLENALSPGGLLELYKETNPLVSGFAFSLFAGAVFLVVSEANRNYSQVDRMWSLLPTLYNAHFLAWSHLHDLSTDRLNIVLLWSVIWSVCNAFDPRCRRLRS
jgi:hypothetical protein